MKISLIEILTFAWMAFTGYLIYEMYTDLNYLTDLVHAYIKMIVENIGHH